MSATLENKTVKNGIWWAIVAFMFLVDIAGAVPPVINNITDSPDPVESGDDVMIIANVTDADGNLSSVWVEINGTNYSMIGVFWPNVTLQPGSKDSYINNGSSGSNYGSSATLLLDQEESVTKRTLIQFGLSAFNGYTINSSFLELYQNDSQAGYRVNASRITNSWNEITNGVTWINAITMPVTQWGTAGGDFSGVYDSPFINSTPGWKRWDLTTLVREWTSGTPNYGVILLPNETVFTSSKLKTFISGDSTNTSYRPRLIVYTAAEIWGYNFSTAGLPPGIYYYTAYANDTTGSNATPVTGNFTVVDTTPPNVTYISPTPEDNANTSNMSITFNATVIDTATAISACLLEFDGVNYTMTVTGTGTSVSCNLTNPSMTEGTHIYTIRANDSAGNWGSEAVRTLTIDTTPPTVIPVLPLPGSNVSGNISINASVNDSSGVNTTTWRWENRTNTSSWSPLNDTLDTTTLQNGDYNITYWANDMLGNINDTMYVAITVTNIPPVINNITDSPEPVVEWKDDVTITANVTDADGDLGSVWVEINGTNNTMIIVNWTTSTLQPDGALGIDSYINNASKTTNYGNDISLLIDSITDSQEKRILIKFDLSNFTDYIINSAYLDLYRPIGGPPYRINASRVTQNWLEDEVTWNNYSSTTAWNDSGGDFSGIYSSISIFGPPGWKTWNLTQLTREWLNGTYPNDGVILIPVTGGGQGSFRSSDYSTQSFRPRFVIKYSMLWEYSYNTANLALGTHNYTVYANDSKGNLVSSTGNFTVVDTTPPTITMRSPANDSTNDSAPLLNATFGEIVNFTWYNVNGTQNLSYSPDTANLTLDLSSLADGTYNVTVYANDSEGNLNSSIVYFTVDTTPPTVVPILPTPGLVSGTIEVNASVNDTSGVDIQQWRWENTSTNGPWNSLNSTLDTAALQNGDYNISYWANDTIGNLNDSEYVAVTVDNTPPSSNSPANATYEANSTGNTIGWILQDTVGTGYYQVLRNGTVAVSWTAWTNNTNLNVAVDTNIGLGLFNYTIYYNDSVGVVGTPDLVWITIEDTTPPSSNSPANATYEANSTGNTIGWVLQDTVGPGYYQVLRNGTVAFSWTPWTNDTNLNVAVDTNIGLGLFNYTIYYNDSQGNIGTPDLVWITIEDTTPLSVENLSTSPMVARVNTTVNITADVTDAVGIDTVLVNINNGAWSKNYTMQKDGNNTWYYEFNETSSIGTYTATIIANDSGGNVNDTESINFTVSLPDLTLSTDNITFSDTTPTAGDSVTITANIHNIGPIDTNSGQIHLKIDGDLKKTDTLYINGSSTKDINYSWTTSSAGTYSITVLLDVNNTIPELNETNNNASRSITVSSPTSGGTGPGGGGPTPTTTTTTTTTTSSTLATTTTTTLTTTTTQPLPLTPLPPPTEEPPQSPEGPPFDLNPSIISDPPADTLTLGDNEVIDFDAMESDGNRTYKEVVEENLEDNPITAKLGAPASSVVAGTGTAMVAATIQSGSSSILPNILMAFRGFLEEFFEEVLGALHKRGIFTPLSRIWYRLLNSPVFTAISGRKRDEESQEKEERIYHLFGYPFSSTELKHMAFSIVTLGIVFAIPLSRDIPSFIKTLPLTTVAASTAIFGHEESRDIVANRLKVWAEYRIWGVGIFLVFATSFIFGNVFATPGKAFIRGGKEVTPAHHGLISLSGGICNFIFALAFYPLIGHGGWIGTLGEQGLLINLVVGVYSMIPIPPMDGYHVFRWNRFIWCLVTVPMIVMAIKFIILI